MSKIARHLSSPSPDSACGQSGFGAAGWHGTRLLQQMSTRPLGWVSEAGATVEALVSTSFVQTCGSFPKDSKRTLQAPVLVDCARGGEGQPLAAATGLIR